MTTDSNQFLQTVWQPKHVATPALPAELDHWNWGAFLLAPLWGPYHRSWLGLLAIVPIVGWFIAYHYGFVGNRLAWQSGRYQTFAQLDQANFGWLKAGVLCFFSFLVISIACSLLFATAVVSKMDQALHSGDVQTEFSHLTGQSV